MTSTERVRRHREKQRAELAEQERITEVYFGGQAPLSESEKRRLLRDQHWQI